MIWIVIYQLCVTSPEDGDALRSTAPSYLTVDVARKHVIAARAAGLAYDVDPDLLLSIAHHESRYQTAVVTLESGGKVSCGVMTPEPTHDTHACRGATSSIVGGYLAGAAHLRGWIDACHGDLHCAELGYAGGYRLIAACARGEEVHGCTTPGNFERRAAQIRRARHAVS